MSEMTANHGKIGVLVMSYGTPQSLEDVEAYYTHIRRGHPPTEEQLADLKGRYEAIVGGVFPLRENTNGQVAGLQDKLEQLAPGRYVCYQGLKHASPYIEDGVKQMAEDGVKQAVGIVLAPHYSTMSVGSYIKRSAGASWRQRNCDVIRRILSFASEAAAGVDGAGDGRIEPAGGKLQRSKAGQSAFQCSQLAGAYS
nr:ferrochelatase [Paenibacillus gorillae]